MTDQLTSPLQKAEELILKFIPIVVGDNWALTCQNAERSARVLISEFIGHCKLVEDLASLAWWNEVDQELTRLIKTTYE